MTETIDLSTMTDEDFQIHVLQLVGRELGVYAAARYIHLNLPKQGDYTRDRHQWLGEQTFDPDEEQPQPESHTQAAV